MDSNIIYAVFISYRWVEPDMTWVRKHFRPALERAGLKVCLDVKDFVPGRNLILEMARVGRESRRAVSVVSPAYFDGNRFAQFESLMLRADDPAGMESRLIPFILRPCEIPDWLRGLISVDWTNEESLENEWTKLLAALEAPNQAVARPPSLGEEDKSEFIETPDKTFDVEQASRIIAQAKNHANRSDILRQIEEGLRTRGDPTERYWMYVTLGEIGGDRAESLLKEGLADANPFARDGAEEALGKMHKPEIPTRAHPHKGLTNYLWGLLCVLIIGVGWTVLALCKPTRTEPQHKARVTIECPGNGTIIIRSFHSDGKSSAVRIPMPDDPDVLFLEMQF